MLRTHSRTGKENGQPAAGNKIPPPSNAALTELHNCSPEERITLAIIAIEGYGFRATGHPRYSILEASKHYSVPRTTLSARLKGRATRHEAHKYEQLLGGPGEELMVQWMMELGYRGVPVTPATATGYAAIIAGKYAGSSWCRRFRRRHPELKAVWSTSLERCRANALNETSVGRFYNMIQELRERYGIRPENEYNMDEKGCQMGIGGRTRVLVDRDQRDVYQIADGDRELVTIVECIPADGGGSGDTSPEMMLAEEEAGLLAIPPMVVYRGMRRDAEWARENPCLAR